MKKKIGIERINLYGTSLYLDQKKLAEARGKDPETVVKDYLIDTRSLNPVWEDAVTMGTNAADPLFLSEEEKNEIGLLVVGTESSVDFGKPISTNIHGALGLPPHVRNFETKHACYSGLAAFDTALNWVASGLNHGKKALVIASDYSRMHLNTKEEFVMGGVATALIVSDNPEVLELEGEKKGTWTTNAYDTFRPGAVHEVGNNEVSLYTYLDALEGSYLDYVQKTGGSVNLENDFKYHLYHTPFAGMAFQAHRTLSNISEKRKKSEIRASFEKKVLPSLRYSRRLGSTYGSSNFVGLCSLLAGDVPIEAGDRISFFAYGSGAIGEFYSGVIGPKASERVQAMKIDEQLDQRKGVSVEEYRQIEITRENSSEKPYFLPDFSALDHWYDRHYKGKGYLVLKDVENFYRNYRRS